MSYFTDDCLARAVAEMATVEAGARAALTLAVALAEQQMAALQAVDGLDMEDAIASVDSNLSDLRDHLANLSERCDGRVESLAQDYEDLSGGTYADWHRDQAYA